LKQKRKNPVASLCSKKQISSSFKDPVIQKKTKPRKQKNPNPEKTKPRSKENQHPIQSKTNKDPNPTKTKPRILENRLTEQFNHKTRIF
jgi:hypothetical protein